MKATLTSSGRPYILPTGERVDYGLLLGKVATRKSTPFFHFESNHSHPRLLRLPSPPVFRQISA
jgi:hypothetical protein